MRLILVEGDGDAFSIPVLLQRVLGQRAEIHILPMGGKSHIVRLEGGFERTILRKRESGFDDFIVLIDADVTFRPYSAIADEKIGMTERAETVQAANNISVKVLWAVREFESWLVGGIGRGDRYCDLETINKPVSGDTQSAPLDPKEWLRQHVEDRRYSAETQLCLTRHIDWTQARKRNKSLRDFVKAF